MIQIVHRALCALGLCVAGGSLLCANDAPKLYFTGSESDAVTQPRFGALLLGGGTEPDDAIAWLLEKADGGDVVVLRASGSNGYNDYFHSEIGGVHSVRTFVFSDRAQSFDEGVLDAIEAAELIFLAGGDQSKYLKYWKGTPVQVLLNQHLRDGKPIGGTSAGLAVLGDTVFAAYGDSIRSSEALKSPFSEHITLERGFLKVPFLENVITDSHFSERGRLGRLLAFQVAAADYREGNAPIGLGVNEQTALAIDASGRAQVFSRSPRGRVYLSIIPPSAQITREEYAPLSISEVMLIGLSTESTVQLPQLSISEAAEFSKVHVVDGRIHELKETDK